MGLQKKHHGYYLLYIQDYILLKVVLLIFFYPEICVHRARHLCHQPKRLGMGWDWRGRGNDPLVENEATTDLLEHLPSGNLT